MTEWHKQMDRNEVEKISVTRWSGCANEWQLVSTGIPVGSPEELKFFRVTVPHESSRKIYFDSPEQYLSYSQATDEPDEVTSARATAIGEAAAKWAQRY